MPEPSVVISLLSLLGVVVVAVQSWRAKKIDAGEEFLSVLREEQKDLRSRVEVLEKKIEADQKAREVERETVRLDHASEMEKIRTAHAAELEKVRLTHEAERADWQKKDAETQVELGELRADRDRLAARILSLEGQLGELLSKQIASPPTTKE